MPQLQPKPLRLGGRTATHRGAFRSRLAGQLSQPAAEYGFVHPGYVGQAGQQPGQANLGFSLAAGGTSGHASQHPQHFVQRAAQLPRGGFRAQGLPHQMVFVFQGVGGLGQQFLPGFHAALEQEIAGVQPDRQRTYTQIERPGGEQLQQLLAAAAPGFVPVEHQHHLVHQRAQQPQVGFGHGRAQHRHHVLLAQLMGHDAIGVPFHHHGHAAAAKRVAGLVQTEQQTALGEKGRFGRVDVLGRLFVGVLGQNASAEPHGPPLGIVDGE